MSEALARVTAALANAEERVGQQQMADLVATAIADGRHLVVQAGTGTGKTLAYLAAAVLSGKKTVISTASSAISSASSEWTAGCRRTRRASSPKSLTGARDRGAQP